jgi:protein-S-isoprenylcysteine O-methyltransferase Ste14
MSDGKARPSEGRDRPGVVAPPPLIFLLAFLLGLAGHRLWPLAVLPGTSGRMVALLLACVAVGVSGLAVREFRRAATSVRPDRPTSAIVRSGPFGYSRNPLYVSALTLLLAAALWVNSVVMAAMLVPAFLVLRTGVVLREERYLERKFGDEYLDYKRITRRWF